MKYKIIRPPLDIKFKLPSRERLLMLEVGDIVKVIFQVNDEPAERMWVILNEISKNNEWFGYLDNDPIGDMTKQILISGMEVKFHPLDIIQIDEERNIKGVKDHLEKSYGIKLDI